MRILVIGATGLIGSAVSARLSADGHDVISGSRSDNHGEGLSGHVRIDLAKVNDPLELLPALRRVDVLVNCAGILQDAPGESTFALHARGVEILAQACELAEVRRFIHFSAVRIDREAPTVFSQSKAQGEQSLMATNLEWVILRPSVVVGHSAYGGSALLRGLAALPILPVGPAGDVQLVHLHDVVDTVAFLLRPDAPVRQSLDLVGPKLMGFYDAVQLFRRWMGWPPAPQIPIPGWIAIPVYKLGDAAALLGWRPPIRTTARLEIPHGAVGDSTHWRALTGIEPRDIQSTLAKEPASVQERWFARLYLLKALVFAVFGGFWLATGIISLGPGWSYGMGLLKEGGLSESFGAVTIVAGALADIAIGASILYRPTSRYGLYAALAISVTYAVIGTILVPRLWADPLGPMLKIWPVIMLNLVALAILEDR